MMRLVSAFLFLLAVSRSTLTFTGRSVRRQTADSWAAKPRAFGLAVRGDQRHTALRARAACTPCRAGHSAAQQLDRDVPFLVAGLDIGSSATKLAVAEAARVDGDLRVGQLLHEEMIRVPYGMGWKLDPKGEIPSEVTRQGVKVLHAMMEQVKALATSHRTAESFHVNAIGTEVFRRAGNGLEFLEQVREACGVKVKLISQAEEARLGFLTGQAVLDMAGEREAHEGLIVYDTGGGSFQFSSALRGARGAPAADLDATGMDTADADLQTFLCTYAQSQMLSDFVKEKAKARLPSVPSLPTLVPMELVLSRTGLADVMEDAKNRVARPMKRGAMNVAKKITHDVVARSGEDRARVNGETMQEILVSLVADVLFAPVLAGERRNGMPPSETPGATPSPLHVHSSLRSAVQAAVNAGFGKEGSLLGLFPKGLRALLEEQLQAMLEGVLLGATDEKTADLLFTRICKRIEEFAQMEAAGDALPAPLASISERMRPLTSATFRSATQWLYGKEVVAICGPVYPQWVVLNVNNPDREPFAPGSFNIHDVNEALKKVYNKPLDDIYERYCRPFPGTDRAFTVLASLVQMKAVMKMLGIRRVHVRHCTGLGPGLMAEALAERSLAKRGS